MAKRILFIAPASTCAPSCTTVGGGGRSSQYDCWTDHEFDDDDYCNEECFVEEETVPSPPISSSSSSSTLPLQQRTPVCVRRSNSSSSTASSNSSTSSSRSSINKGGYSRSSFMMLRSDSFSDMSTLSSSNTGFYDENDEESGHGTYSSSALRYNNRWSNAMNQHGSSLNLTSISRSSSPSSFGNSADASNPATPRGCQYQPIQKLSSLSLASSLTSSSSSSLSPLGSPDSEWDDDTVPALPLTSDSYYRSPPALRRRYLESCRRLLLSDKEEVQKHLSSSSPFSHDQVRLSSKVLFNPHKRKFSSGKRSSGRSTLNGTTSTKKFVTSASSHYDYNDTSYLVLMTNLFWITGMLVLFFVYPVVLPPSLTLSSASLLYYQHQPERHDHPLLHDDVAAVEAATTTTSITSAVDAVVYVATGPVVISEVLSWSIESVIVQGQWDGPIYLITDNIEAAKQTLRNVSNKGQFVFVHSGTVLPAVTNNTLSSSASPARAAKVAKSRLLDILPSNVQKPLYLDSDIIVGHSLQSFWSNLESIWEDDGDDNGSTRSSNDVSLAMAEDAKAFTMNRCYACDTWNTGVLSIHRGKSERCLQAWYEELISPSSAHTTDQAALDHVIATTDHCSNIHSIDTKTHVRMMKDAFVVAGLVPVKTFNHFTGLFGSTKLSSVHRYSYQRDILSSIGRDLDSVHANDFGNERTTEAIIKSSSPRLLWHQQQHHVSRSSSITSSLRQGHNKVWDSTLL